MRNDRMTLLELNGLVRELIETAMPNEYWVEASCRSAARVADIAIWSSSSAMNVLPPL